MKTAIVINRDEQRGEILAFMQHSGLNPLECEIWRLTGEPFVAVESMLASLVLKYNQMPVDILLFAAESPGAELATRLAIRLKGDAICGISEADFHDEAWVSKPVYGNAMTAKLRPAKKPWCFSVARSARTKASFTAIPEQELQCESAWPEWLLGVEPLPERSRPALATAKIVLAVGQGIHSRQNMDRAKQIANELGAETGASRQAVMNAWCEMERLIGMSGTLVAPDICIAAGVSGASAFTAGIRHSGLIVAVNSDPQAAIFAEADVGIVDDLMPVLEALGQLASQLPDPPVGG